jgi:hypothetical protein
MRSTIDLRAGGAVWRVMAQLVGWGLSIAGRNFTHNAGVGSSSLPPATSQSVEPEWVRRFLFIVT